MRSIRYLKCGLGLLGPVSLGFGGLGCKVQGSGLECMASGIWVLWGFVGGGGWMCREFRVVCHGLLEVTWIRGVQVYPADPVARGKERFQSLRFCSARDDACLSESAGLCPVPTPNLAARGERPRLSDIHLRMSVHGRGWIHRGLSNGTGASDLAKRSTARLACRERSGDEQLCLGSHVGV